MVVLSVVASVGFLPAIDADAEAAAEETDDDSFEADELAELEAAERAEEADLEFAILSCPFLS